MEKHTPHYDLAVIKEEVLRQGAKAFSQSALWSGKRMGIPLHHMQQTICSLERRMLYKSMTSYTDYQSWHDVYHTQFHELELYVKVTYGRHGGPPVISFKERTL